MSPHRPPERPLLLRDVQVLTGLGDTLERVDVLVRDGSIGEISAQRLEAPGARVIEGAGKTLLPGLIDAHTHLDFLSVRHRLRSWIQARFVLPRALGELARHGVTTIRCLADPLRPVTRLRRRAAAGRFVSPAILTAGPALTAPGGHPEATLAKDNPWLRKHIALTVTDPELAGAAVRRLHAEGADLIKLVYQGGLYGPERIRLRALDRDSARAVIEQAHRLDLPVSAHTHYQDDVAELLAMGVDSIEHGVIEHELDGSETLQAWTASGARLVPTLSIAALFAGPSGQRYIETAGRNLTQAYEAGVRIVAGTDSMIGAMPANTLHEELRLMVQAGMSESEAIRAATSEAAELLGLPDRGVIEPGRRADLVLLRSDPLERIENIADIDLVIRGGAVIHDAPEPPRPPRLDAYVVADRPTLTYLDRTGSTVDGPAGVRYDRSRFADEGIRTLTYTDREEGTVLRVETAVSGADLVTRTWRCEIPAARTDLRAAVDGGSIVLTGTLEGEPVTRTYPLRGRTWMQLLPFDAATFITSTEPQLSFVAIGTTGRGALQLTEFELERKGSSSDGGSRVEAELVMPRWRRFWGALAQFESRSGDLVRQQIRGRKDQTLERVDRTPP